MSFINPNKEHRIITVGMHCVTRFNDPGRTLDSDGHKFTGDAETQEAFDAVNALLQGRYDVVKAYIAKQEATQ